MATWTGCELDRLDEDEYSLAMFQYRYSPFFTDAARAKARNEDVAFRQLCVLLADVEVRVEGRAGS